MYINDRVKFLSKQCFGINFLISENFTVVSCFEATILGGWIGAAVFCNNFIGNNDYSMFIREALNDKQRYY